MTRRSPRSGLVPSLLLLLVAALGAGCSPPPTGGEDTPCQDDAQACNSGFVCLYGFCKRSCEITGTCCPNDAATCDVAPPPCGHSGEACCENNGCGPSLLCENNVCRACGGYRQYCCPDSAAGCQAGYTCDTDAGDPGICQ